MQAPPPIPKKIQDVFAPMPQAAAQRLIAIRGLIFDTAEKIQAVGELSETLKWGQPAYLTQASKSGSTLRIGTLRAETDHVALFVNCQTILADTFRQRLPEKSGGLRVEGDRAVWVPLDGPLPVAPLRECIALTLTYHHWRKELKASL